MPKTFETIAVIVVITVTIAAEALFTLWSQTLNYAGTPLNDSLELLVSWALIALGLIAVVAIVGPKHERVWLVALLFLVVAVLTSFYVSQIVLAEYRYRREFTSAPIDPIRYSVLFREARLNSRTALALATEPKRTRWS